MHKAKKIKTQFPNEQHWYYRGGTIEKYPSVCGRRKGNWHWSVCGVNGWVDNKEQAKAAIDRLLSLAKQILDAEKP